MQSPTTSLQLLLDALNAAVPSGSVPAGLIEGLADDELLLAAAAIEGLGRRVDALRVVATSEVEDRSRRELGTDSLAVKKGCRTSTELLQRVTLCSASTLMRRIALGRDTRPVVSLIGEVRPARFPHLANALAEGIIGVDSAAAIARALAACGDRAAVADLNAAEVALVGSATGERDIDDDLTPAMPFSADEVRLQALVWQAVLDPDGDEDAEERAMARRGLRLGRERDGVIPLTGALMPEIAAKLQRIFDAYLSPKSGPAFALAAGPHRSADKPDPELVVDRADDRVDVKETRWLDQQRHDILAGVVDLASRSSETPILGGVAPTVLVSVNADDLERSLATGRTAGVGFIDGLDVPVRVSMRTVKQFACNGGIQPIVFGPAGDIHQLGSPQRCFTPQQRRAILLRDGGCAITGCSAPGAWCEIHHVLPDAQNGETHTSNGVALCWFHHRTIDTSGWKIRMINGSPHLKCPPWIDPSAMWKPVAQSPTRVLNSIRGRLSRQGHIHAPNSGENHERNRQ